MKRNLTTKLSGALVLAVVTAVLLAVGAGADSFADVPADSYYAPAVLWALDNGVTTGTSVTTFSPSDTCTRGQVVTFLWRASGRPEPKAKSCPFTDVAPGSYYEKAVLWAVEQGITNGTSAKEFSPDALCTSAHILTFLWRSLGQPVPGVNGTLPMKDPDAYYVLPWVWAANNDMLRDMDGFDIEAACSRAMTVTWLYRASLGWDPDVVQRQTVAEEGAVCGVCYAGGSGGKSDLAGLLTLLGGRKVTTVFPFLEEIPEENIVRTEGGQDLFVVVPRSPEAEVTVRRFIVDETNDYKGAAGEVLYHSRRGQPILLCVNVSEIAPDTVVIVKNPPADGGGTVIFTPSVSMKNGRLSTRTMVELEDITAFGKFCDLTSYPTDKKLGVPEGIRFEPDDSMKPDAGGIKAVWDAVPGAVEYVVKFYTRFPQDEGWELREFENPDEPEASYFCQDYYMIRVDLRAASDKGLGPVTSVVLTEEELTEILFGKTKR
ncbi:MAG: S-layer homology domain-containing protein [Ruminococcaceae bacterium]|jgi:hypothetical protein|nr:S-layer homology domain-containing protein [Oscillospiraceae bacterium]